ncbi:MAG: dodecin domain-containing protein [Planctomycetaceae bacterium]|nr:dodecin domain-containing protein [Planctomycetaceae bacterium]
MGNPVFKQVEITGTSEESVSAAIESAVEKAASSLREMSWFELTDLRGSIDEGEVQQYQASIKVGFKLDD